MWSSVSLSFIGDAICYQDHEVVNITPVSPHLGGSTWSARLEKLRSCQFESLSYISPLTLVSQAIYSSSQCLLCVILIQVELHICICAELDGSNVGACSTHREATDDSLHKALQEVPVGSISFSDATRCINQEGNISYCLTLYKMIVTIHSKFLLKGKMFKAQSIAK